MDQLRFTVEMQNGILGSFLMLLPLFQGKKTVLGILYLRSGSVFLGLLWTLTYQEATFREHS